MKIEGRGYITWVVPDTNGGLRSIKVKAYYVPQCKAKLLSTSAFLDEYPDEEIVLKSGILSVGGKEGDPTRGPIIAAVNPVNNLPTSTAYRHTIRREAEAAIAPTLSAVADGNINLSEPAKELMRWHFRLAHLDLRKIQFLMRTGVLATSEATRRLHTAAAKLQVRPQCAACHFGKQHRRPTPGVKSVAIKDRAGVLSAGHLLPGAQTSVDHFVCSTKGRLFTSRGKSLDKDMYMGGAIFVDHASGHVHVEFQTSTSSHATLESKHKYEAMARDVGVVPQTYLADNGTSFTSAAFTEKLRDFQQTIRFAGAGAHHHNGRAERAIRTIMSIARTMMLHAGIHWGDMADLSLWPMAVQHAVYVYNRVPDPSTGMCPLDLFTNMRWPQAKLHDLHVWGCPVYVLDKAISDGKKLPKWKPRSRRCIYMGQSPLHASSVPLVLDPATGSITAQFHCVFDDWFSTVSTAIEDIPDYSSEAWQKLFGDSEYQYTFDDDDDANGGGSAVDVDPAGRRERVESAVQQQLPPVPLPGVQNEPAAARTVGSGDAPVSATREEQQSIQQGEQLSSLGAQQSVSSPSPAPAVPIAPTDISESQHNSPSGIDISQFVSGHGSSDTNVVPPTVPVSEPKPAASSSTLPASASSPSGPTSPRMQTRSQREKPAQASPVRRSTRTTAGKRSGNRFGFDGSQSHGYLVDESPYQFDVTQAYKGYDANGQYVGFAAMSDEEATGPYATPGDPHAHLTYEDMADICDRERSGTRKGSMSNYYSYKAATSDPDTLDYDAAMNDQFVDEWRKAAKKEIEQLEAHGTWVLDDISNATSRILPGTWVFKLKRDPDGNPTKFKARYCVRGDLQEGSDDTYAPVTAWPSVRVFLVFAMVMSWTTASIDFSNAFVHATLEKPLWIHLPRGFHAGKPGKFCLRLKRSLYGTRDAPRLFYECASAAFEELGFKKSEHDPCFFYKRNMMLVLYVDDVGVAAKDPKDIDRLVDALRSKGFELTREGSFSEFLGIKISPVNDEGPNSRVSNVARSVHMTQRGLIDKIVATLGLENCRPNWTPAQQAALGIDPDGPPMKEDWSYPSVIGMLLYLSTNTRPDIAYAVSQVARFTHAPKQSHAVAVKMIGRYLRRTRDYGTIVSPTGDLNLELYVDADFAGLYGRDPERSSSSVRSRTGYIVFFGGIPLVWRSFLQTEISLSTLESEYSSLSHAIRTLIPIRSLVLELAANLQVPESISTSISSTVFEDNNGALLLANNQRITSRTRYFQVKWHFFWEYVKRGDVKVVYISTDQQKADFLTKMNPKEVFEKIRKMVQGW